MKRLLALLLAAAGPVLEALDGNLLAGAVEGWRDRSQRYERELEENRQWITHVHLSEADRAAPGKPLSPQMARFLNALRAVGYEGPASFECHMEDPSVMEAAREAVAEALGA